MGKTIFLGLLLVLAAMVTLTTSFVHPPPIAQTGVEKISPAESKESSSSEDSSESTEDKEQMLCNVIVRATHDLHVYQRKSMDEIITYLNADCKNLETEELVEQCQEIVTQSGSKIYEHVKNGMDMSQVCEKLDDDSEMDLDGEEKPECSREHADKCQCCKMHVQKRKMRLRHMVIQITKKRMCMCRKSPRPDRCRQWIRRKAHRALKKINKICPQAICKHLGYCEKLSENNNGSKLMVEPKVDTASNLPLLWRELLDQQLEAHFNKTLCSDFRRLQALCIHVAASVDSREYARMYMTVFQNDMKWIDKGLREKISSLQSSNSADRCGACKNIIQSSTAFYLHALEMVRNALTSHRGHFEGKEEMNNFFNKRLDTIKTYLQSLKPDEFCSAAHLCSSALPIVRLPVKDGGDCASCVQRLQPRKDAAKQAINLLSVYFTDLCTKMGPVQCQEFVSEMVADARSFVDEFDVQETCSAMGFCGQNTADSLNDCEHAFVEEIGKQFCTTLGPFETLCQQVVQGDSKRVQMINLNGTNFNAFFQQCEEETDEKNAVSTTSDQCSQDKDKCQCCIAHVMRKKKCLKKRVAKYVWHMLELCKRCPAREKCAEYWKKKKACWDAKIDKICPKKACVRMGYCPEPGMRKMCIYMGPFNYICQAALNNIEQSLAGLTSPAIGQANDAKENLQPKKP